MFIFHEGLPRSGKTYEAVVKRIIPALQKGRKVYARINGLNHERIAEASGVPVERVKELLFEIPEADVLKWAEIVENDSLVILDEMQNFWPHGSARSMSQSQIQAIAEHGHRGLDIVGMGQLLKGAGGVHANWVNRCDQKIVFEKQNGLGKSNKYRWTAYKGTHDGRGIRFLKTNSGVVKYDEKYFGTYRTRVEGSENAETYQDSRTNILTNPVFRKILPLVLLAGAAAVYYMFYLFKGGGLEKSFHGSKPTATATATATVPAAHAPAPAGDQKAAPAPPDKKGEKDFIEDLCERYRLRVTAIIKSATKQSAMFEWYDEAMHVKERLPMLAIAQMGYAVVLDDDMQYATLRKGKNVYVATQFPNDPDGRISEANQREIAGYPDRRGGNYAMPPSGNDGGRVVNLGADGYGVLGKAGAGVREPGTQTVPQTQTSVPGQDLQQPRVPTSSPWRAS